MNHKIKWVKNSKVKRNPRISQSDVVEENYRNQGGEIIVTMVNSSKKFPILNIEFPSATETSERKEKNSAGKWITKSWVTKHKLIASVNTEENCIHFNRTRFDLSELNRVAEVMDYVIKTVLKKFVTTSPLDSFSSNGKNLKKSLDKTKKPVILRT